MRYRRRYRRFSRDDAHRYNPAFNYRIDREEQRHNRQSRLSRRALRYNESKFNIY